MTPFARKPKPANSLMMNWLKKANTPLKSESDDSLLPEVKRVKKEHE